MTTDLEPSRVSLSVVIVAFRSERDLSACLASIPPKLEATRPVEIFVIDNSPDDAARPLVSLCPHAQYVFRPENLGFGRASNLGYRLSKGDTVLFLNPDTVCNESALLHCMNRLHTDPSIGLISPRLVMANGTMDLACRRSIPTLWDGFCRASGLAAKFPRQKIFSGYNLSYLPEAGTYEVGAINGAFMMGRREMFENVGLFDEQFFMYGDDLDLCIRCAKAGYRIVYDGHFSIVHLKGQSVAQDYARMSNLIFDANRDVYLKHFNSNDRAWVRFKYNLAFGLWKRLSRWRARRRSYTAVRPL